MQNDRKMRAIATVTLATAMLTAFAAVTPSAAQTSYSLQWSASADRSAPAALEGQTVVGDIYVFTSPETSVSMVEYWLDDSAMSGPPIKTERRAPYDFAGTAADDTAFPYDTTQLADGEHTITQQVTLGGGATEVTSSAFTVANNAPALQFDTSSARILALTGGDGSRDVILTDNTGDSVAFTIAEPSVDWLSVDPISGTTPATVTLTGSAAQLAPGDYTTTLTASGVDVLDATLQITLKVADSFPSDQVHLAWVGDSATTLTVVWRTLDTLASEVRYRSLGDVDWQLAAGAVRESGAEGVLHEVALTGLLPDTAYEYEVAELGGLWSHTRVARTAPLAGSSPFTMAFVADTGLVGRPDGLATGTQQVIDELVAMAPLAVLLGGDYAYYNTDPRFPTLDDAIDAWFNQMQPVGSASVLMPTYGNHEVVLSLLEGFTPWAQRFPTPDGFNDRRFYSFDVGDVHFVSILAERDSVGLTSAELQWIDDDISAARLAGQTWIVPYMHVPCFGDGTNHPGNTTLRAQLGPIFENRGVQLVLSAHDQAFERTYPLQDIGGANTAGSPNRRCYEPGDGVVWAKISPGGKLSNINLDFSDFGAEPPPSWTAVRNNALHHYAALTINGASTLQLDTWGVSGDGSPPVLIDRFVISREAACTPELRFDIGQFIVEEAPGAVSERSTAVVASDGATPAVSVSDDADWLTVSQTDGSTPLNLTLTLDTTGLAAGRHTAIVEATATGYLSARLLVVLQVVESYDLLVSSLPDRSAPTALEGQTVFGDMYVFTSPETDVSTVEFWLDDAGMSGAPLKTEGTAPYDFAGTAVDDSALPYDTTQLADGDHTITQRVTLNDGAAVVTTSSFTVENGSALLADPTSLSFTALEGETTIVAQDVGVSASDGASPELSAAADAGWLTVTPGSATAPAVFSVSADPSGLSAGSYAGVVTVSAGGYQPVAIAVSLTITSDGAPSYSLQLSGSPDRSAPVALEGQSVFGDVYVFTAPETDISTVDFWLDDSAMSGAPIKTEGRAPYDFAGTAVDDSALPYDTTQLANGDHTITQRVTLNNGATVVTTSNFTVDNGSALVVEPTALSFSAPEGATTVLAQDVSVSASDGGSPDLSAGADAAWLTVTPGSATAPAVFSVSVDPSGLSAGSYAGEVTVSALGYAPASFSVSLRITSDGSASYTLQVSASPDRSAPAALEGRTVFGDVYVFTAPETDVSTVEFWLDDAAMSGAPIKTEGRAPYDFAGTAADGTALPYDTTQLADGVHAITQRVTLNDGAAVVTTSSFTVENGSTLLADPSTLSFSAPEGETTALAQDVSVSASDGANPELSAGADAAWLTVTPSSVTAPAVFSVSVDPTGLSVGSYAGEVTVSAQGYAPAAIPVSLSIQSGGAGCFPYSVLPCAELLVDTPYSLEWNTSHGGLTDAAGTGTGFTMVLPTTQGSGDVPDDVLVDTASPGVLQILTSKGLFHLGVNSQDNALGVGVSPNTFTKLSTTLIDIPAGTGRYEQAGLWYGIDEDNYHKLVVISDIVGPRIQHMQELAGEMTESQSSNVLALSGSTSIQLHLVIDPFAETIAAEYSINGGATVSLGSFAAPSEIFNKDQAGIDPVVGTRVFGGVFASHRNGSGALVYTFDDFSLSEVPPPEPTGSIGFVGTSYGVPFPTSMAWGTDGRLYVTEILGDIHALTIDADQQVVEDELINLPELDNRLLLGITEGPSSTADTPVIWVAHSGGVGGDPFNNGEINSSTVSRITLANGSYLFEDFIIGLPRAIANHAINSIHFGLDDDGVQKLFIAMGGNTGGGAPNTAATEFGPRPEQPLSAAILVADVLNPDFVGICGDVGCTAPPCLSWVDDSTGTADNAIPASCDVEIYASGLRNSYDFVFHSNGEIYATDNGLGVAGSFPPFPDAPCTGFASTAPVSEGGQNPGSQPDLLLRLVRGAYFGHPNPQRDECVFKDGSYQGVSPLPTWEPPMFVLGQNLSANGIIEYPFDVGCVSLQQQLLIVNFALGNNITRTKLSADGLSVEEHQTLVTGFNDPLPLSVRADGTIYVGEFGADLITALQPYSLGCWDDGLASMPAVLLDAGGGALNGLLYSVGGKTASGHVSTLYIYDPALDSWSQGPDLPGAAVENPAVAAYNGELYVFGGSTAPFSGAVANAARYNPLTGAWTPLTPMPTPRGGATAQEIKGLLYVIGGLDGSGASVDTVEVYDPLTDSWGTAAPMSSRRDNPGSAVLEGQIYIFGGRIRESDGTEVDGTLNTVESYDPATGIWTPRAPMPTGRRTMIVGTLSSNIPGAEGRICAQVTGGEKTPDGLTFPSNEQYDPVTDTWSTNSPMSIPRHGAAYATIGNVLYVAGGGATGGSDFTAVTSRFGF